MGCILLHPSLASVPNGRTMLSLHNHLHNYWLIFKKYATAKMKNTCNEWCYLELPIILPHTTIEKGSDWFFFNENTFLQLFEWKMQIIVWFLFLHSSHHSLYIFLHTTVRKCSGRISDLDGLKDVLESSWYDPSLSWGVWHTLHGEWLSTSCLTVSENCAIVSFSDPLSWKQMRIKA